MSYKIHEQKLQQFYKEILEWFDAGTPKHPVFRKIYGLCANLGVWLDANVEDLQENQEIWDQQSILFRKLYGDSQFPFGEEDYKLESKARNHFKNEKRLAFLRSQAGEQK